MKATIKKINELVYPDVKMDNEIVWNNQMPNLEMLLVALPNEYDVFKNKNDFLVTNSKGSAFIWQLNKTLTEQSESTQETIKNLFE